MKTHQLKSNSQSGFAIGLILLAVVLIAAIVAAIAVSTQDSGGSADREQARIQASTLIQQGIALGNADVRWRALGGSYDTTTPADAADAMGDFLANSSTGTLEAVPTAASTSTFRDSTLSTGAGPSRWKLLVENTGSGIRGFAYLPWDNPSARGECAQINSILWGASPNPANVATFADAGGIRQDCATNTPTGAGGDNPGTGSATCVDAGGTDVVLSAGTPDSSDMTITGVATQFLIADSSGTLVARNEGCLADTGNDLYYYIKVLGSS